MYAIKFNVIWKLMCLAVHLRISNYILFKDYAILYVGFYTNTILEANGFYTTNKNYITMYK